MPQFVSFFSFLDTRAAGILSRIADEFPAEMERALTGVAFHMRRKLKVAMTSGGPEGHKWPELSNIQQYRRLDLLKSDGNVSLKRISKKNLAIAQAKGHYMPNAMLRWRKGPKRGDRSMGRMVGGIHYKKEQTKLGVVIGGLTPSMDRYLRAVQMGGVLQGNSKYPQQSGAITITPKMRRLYFLAGIPLKKGRTTLSFPKRPLILPVFKAHAQHIYNYIQLAIDDYVNQRVVYRDDRAKQAGFGSSYM